MTDTPPSATEQATNLWHCYFFLCEEHDRNIAGPGGTPASPEQMEKIGSHAVLLRDQLRQVAESLGVSSEDLDRTRKQALRLPKETNQAEAEKSGLLPRFE